MFFCREVVFLGWYYIGILLFLGNYFEYGFGVKVFVFFEGGYFIVVIFVFMIVGCIVCIEMSFVCCYVGFIVEVEGWWIVFGWCGCVF